MRVVVVGKRKTDYESLVDGYLREFEYRTGKTLERIDPESRDGADFCRIYDITEYPTIIALDDLGVVHNIWRGLPLPLINEVSFYV